MSLPSQILQFGEWLPDLGEVGNPGLVTATNVIPTATGYGQVLGLATEGYGALTGAAKGAHFVRWDETSYVLAADAERLYLRQADGTFNNVSKSGDYTARDFWIFATFGPRVVAIAEFQAPQVINVSDTTPQFADLANAPDWAGAAAVVRDFLVIGNTGSNSDGPNVGETFVQWSGFNDIEYWGSNLSRQADFQQLVGDGGRIQAIAGGDVGLIFQQNSVWKMQYAGPPIIFQFDEIAVGRGTPAPQSVVRLDNMVYYYDHAGFYSVDTRSNQFHAIGSQKVDQWVAENYRDHITGFQATADPERHVIIWRLDDSDLLVYHYDLQRWSLIEMATEHIARLPTIAHTLDTLDTVLPGGIDANSIRVDSHQFSGIGFHMAAFDAEHRFGTMTGTPLDAEFVLGDIGTDSDNIMYCNQQRPYVDVTQETNVFVQVGYRDNLFDNHLYTPLVPRTSYGFTDAQTKARFLQFRMSLQNGFNNVNGLEIFRQIR